MDGKIKLGSLFDGSGGFPLAGALHGIEPVWASEIEPFPIRVTTNRFPGMKHLGSVTDVKGDEVDPVDIITFGSPCQDLSVAGKQLGIHDGERSNLFFEAIRIIKEMRHATADKYPRFAVWENVPGAFSSNNGKDFQAVLQAFADVIGNADDTVPGPPTGGGNLLGAYWETVGALPGVSTTLNTGEFPSVARESTLSQILQLSAPDRYSLSGKAALGIMRRARKRGKELPTMLLEALTETCRFAGLDVNDADLPDDGEEFEDGVFTMDDDEEYDE